MEIEQIMETMDYGPVHPEKKLVEEWLASHGRTWGSCSEEKGIDASPMADGGGAAAKTAAASGVDRAVLAAGEALPAWAGLSPLKRARSLDAIAAAMKERQRLIAALASLESGRVIRLTLGADVPAAARLFSRYANAVRRLAGRLDALAPAGVAAVILGSGASLMALAQLTAPALAAGCTVVVQAGPGLSLTAQAFAEVCRDAGLPPGAVTVVTGGDSGTGRIAGHSGIARVAYAGGSGNAASAENAGAAREAAWVRQVAAGAGKRLVTQLTGGKPLYIVFDDADLDSAVDGFASLICMLGLPEGSPAGGQVPIRLLVQEGVAPRWRQKLRRRLQALRVGDPLDRGVDLAGAPGEGAGQLQALLDALESALPACTFRTPAEALEFAHAAPGVRWASVWSEKASQALDIASRLELDTVMINDAREPAVAEALASTGTGGGVPGGLWDAFSSRIFEYLTAAGQAMAKAGEEAKEASDKAGAPDPTRQPTLSDDPGRVGLAVDTAKAAAKRWREAPGWFRAERMVSFASRLEAAVEGAGQWSDGAAAAAGQERAALEAGALAAVRRLYAYAAWAESLRGAVSLTGAGGFPGTGGATAHGTGGHGGAGAGIHGAYGSDGTAHGIWALSIPRPAGVIAIVCPDESPLVSFASLVAPAIAAGNTVVVVPSRAYPAMARELSRIIELSELPAGVIHVIEGHPAAVGSMLAEHPGVDALWYFGPLEGQAGVAAAAARGHKSLWMDHGRRDWLAPVLGEGPEILCRATRAKTIWIPYGA